MADKAIQDMLADEGFKKEKESEVEPTPEPEVKPEPTPEPTPEPEPDPPVVNSIEEDNRILREKLNEMARMVQQGKVAPSPTPAPEPEPEPEPERVVKGTTPLEFITKEEADLLIDRPDEIMPKILNRVFEAGRETVFREMQPYIIRMISDQVNVLKKVENFYNQNSDLADYKDFVALVGNSIEQEHPDWTIDKVYDETAKVARERLRLQASVKSNQQEPTGDLQTPALPRTKGARGPRTTPEVKDESLKALTEMWESQIR